jgi:segregation and condensation protein B
MSRSFIATGQILGSVALCYRQLPPRLGINKWLPWWVSRHFAWIRLDDEHRRSRGPAARDQRQAQLEAVLLLATEPLGSRKLAQLAGLADGTKARTLVRALNKQYDSEGCAFRVEEVAGGFQLMTRPQFAPWLRRLHSAPIEVRLSAPAMETLAVVAYRQPVLRAEIEAIRGVQCDEVLRQLIERDLVHITGRSEELGRPMLYGTTRQFLQIFGLRHLDELPRLAIMLNSNATAPGSVADKTTNQLNHNLEVEEETNVKTSVKTNLMLDETLADEQAVPARRPDHYAPLMEEAAYKNEEEDDDFDEDEDDEDFDDEEDEDEDLTDDVEDEPWEEVDDDDEDDEFEDEDDDEDDWDDDEDWADDDWDDDEDDDLDDDDEATEEDDE